MNTWKWSKGEPYCKSARTNKSSNSPINRVETHDDSEIAIKQSLETDNFFTQDLDMMSITNSVFSRHATQSSTSREDLDSKIAIREPIAQRGINPFLQTSYVNDIVTRDMFLKPLNTTQGRTKASSDQESNETTNHYNANIA